MKRHEAIQNAMLVTNYLSMHECDAYLILDINELRTRIRYFNAKATKEEARQTTMMLDRLRHAESKSMFQQNDERKSYSVDITWDIDNE